MLSGWAAPVTMATLSVSAMANGASKNSACVRGGIYKGRVGREGAHPFPRAPCSSWGVSRGFEGRACARPSRRTPGAMQRAGPGKGAFPLVRTTGVCSARSLPLSKSTARAFFNSLLMLRWPGRQRQPVDLGHVFGRELPLGGAHVLVDLPGRGSAGDDAHDGPPPQEPADGAPQDARGGGG